MPKVLATGFMVGLFEWACIQAINPHIDWPREQTVGIAIKLSHLAATPPGLTVNVKVKLEEVEGRRLVFSIVADDGMDTISEGTHDRFIIDAAKFNAKIATKKEEFSPERFQ
jgi:fluoroacetyl-CoA thioesterase